MNFCCSHDVAARYEWINLDHIGRPIRQLGQSLYGLLAGPARLGSGTTRPAGSGQARSQPILTGRARLYWSLAYLARWEHWKLLLARDDINPNKPNRYGQTPLSEATHNGHEGVVKLLLGQDGVSHPGGTNQVEHSGVLLRAACGGNSSSSLLSPSSVA